MDASEIKEYLRENLCIYVSQIKEFGPIEEIEVTLELEGDEISRSSCSLPSTPL